MENENPASNCAGEPEKISRVPQAVPFVPEQRKFPEPEVSPAVKKWSVKIALILIALVVLQIPLYMVRDLSLERRKSERAAAGEIAAVWGNALTIGDIFCGSAKPEKLAVKSVIAPEIRYRGIYQSVVYTSSSTVNARFASAGKEIFMQMSSFNGLQDAAVKINGREVPFTILDNGMKIVMPEGVAGAVECEISLKCRGSSQFRVHCSGRRNTVEISGTWNAPNFGISSVLPVSRQVTEKDFTAGWEVNDLLNQPGSQVAGVEMHIAAGTYQQVERTMTYATFFLIVFFFTLLAGELITRTTVHPLQYLVASGAPVLFYLMLLAVGEKTGFAAGFAISAAVIVAMVTGYARMFLGRMLPAALIGVVFAVSYAVNYFILQMEEFALLSGTVVLAVVLGVLMILTGKLNSRDAD